MNLKNHFNNKYEHYENVKAILSESKNTFYEIGDIRAAESKNTSIGNCGDSHLVYSKNALRGCTIFTPRRLQINWACPITGHSVSLFEICVTSDLPFSKINYLFLRLNLSVL